MGLLSRKANGMHEPPAGSVAASEYPQANSGIAPGPNNTYEHGNVLDHTDPNAQTGMMNQHQHPQTHSKRGLFGRNTHHDHTTGTGLTTQNTGSTHTGPAPMLNANTQTSPRTSRESGSSAGTGTQHTMIEEGKLRRKGKMESTMGTLLCNSNMKRKSEAHLAQADHLKMQASELGEAERLEAEAGMRRQRAVGLGADPAQATGQTGYAQRTAAV